MTTDKSLYAEGNEVLKAIQRQPIEAQRTILDMIYGAIAISDLYTAQFAKERIIAAEHGNA